MYLLFIYLLFIASIYIPKFISLTMKFCFTPLAFCFHIAIKLSQFIQHCNLGNSTSIVTNAFKWRAPCKSTPAEGLPSSIESNGMKLLKTQNLLTQEEGLESTCPLHVLFNCAFHHQSTILTCKMFVQVI